MKRNLNHVTKQDLSSTGNTVRCFSRKKNSFITFITPELQQQIANSQEVSYASLRKRIEKNKLRMRLNEFRDKFGTHLLNNGILEAEQNLVCGRIASSVFIKFYWSPKLKQLGDRILKELETIENSRNHTIESSLLS